MFLIAASLSKSEVVFSFTIPRLEMFGTFGVNPNHYSVTCKARIAINGHVRNPSSWVPSDLILPTRSFCDDW